MLNSKLGLRLGAETTKPATSPVTFSIWVCLLVIMFAGCVDQHQTNLGDGGGVKLREETKLQIYAHEITQESKHEPAHCDLKIRGRHAGGRLLVTLNGFPIETSSGIMRYDTRRSPLTTALVGEDNRVVFQSKPLLQIGRTLRVRQHDDLVGVVRCNSYPISDARIAAAKVDNALHAWTDRAEKHWQAYRSKTTNSHEALDSLRAWADRNPMTVSTTFENETGPDFSDIFEEAPVISDTSRLKDYAMRLRELMTKQDTAALFEEFRPSIMDRFEMRSFESRAEYMEENRNAVVLEEAILDFGPDDVRVRRWVDGRVWEIWRAGSENQAFFERPSGYGLGELYVAEVDGELRVVR